MPQLKIKSVNPALWGGIECTINRVNNRFLDQLDMAGFYHNSHWMNAVIATGISCIRFPVLWEKHQSTLLEKPDFSFASFHLNKLRENHINPVVGLLHHGSGPAFTNLLDPHFPELFAAYAAQVATEFPWVTHYTPINEPLTTARFSGLYGLWYPHKKNDVSFVKMLLNQLKATVLAMAEIRKINPAALLLQTEDLGKTYSSSVLAYQASFENTRRWLTFDILSGKFDQAHPLWNYFMRLGIEKAVLQFFTDHPCKPDIIGANYYVTSERYLDDAIDQYPGQYVGGNSLHHYVDVEGVRVAISEPHGLEILLRELSNRYSLPIALTEVHIHCSREEQLRWLNNIHEIAVRLVSEAVPVIAVTAWALFGSFGWNKLLTCDKADCEYEPGIFDVSNATLRATALQQLLQDLAQGKKIAHDLVQQPGWWKRNDRFYNRNRKPDDLVERVSSRPIVIIGKTGTLGKAFSLICKQRHLHHYLLNRQEVDICNEADIEQMINRYHPWAIINAAGFVRVAEAENEPAACYRENYIGVQKLAVLCERFNIKLLSFSSDMVFDGSKSSPYTEADLPNPLNVYGKSKWLAETFLQQVNPSSLIIRTSAFFGPWDKFNFVYNCLEQFEKNTTVFASADIISPTYVPHLVHAALNLLVDKESGTWHIVNKGEISWYSFAQLIAARFGYDAALVKYDNARSEKTATTPNRSLCSTKYTLMPTLEQGIDHYFSDNIFFHQNTSVLKALCHE